MAPAVPLRQLLACTEAHLVRRTLFTSYEAVLVSHMPETPRLATELSVMEFCAAFDNRGQPG